MQKVINIKIFLEFSTLNSLINIWQKRYKERINSNRSDKKLTFSNKTKLVEEHHMMIT
jgi:hypothetical protein